MCGVSFYWSDKAPFSNRLSLSLLATKHRGPDASGIYEYVHDDSTYIGLGHNRLSILEVSELGNQPMHKDDNLSIIFNGEIYNHKFLRNYLIELGYLFVGNSDTEVVLNLYAELGINAFSMLKGMFVIVILDKKSRTLNVVRDVIGIKPVYITKNKYGIFGCSEIKGLKLLSDTEFDIDADSVYEFFNNGFLYEPSTGFKGVTKLMPGFIMSIDLLTGKTTQKQLITVEEHKNNDSLESKIEHAIQNQLIADVPLGVFFSGGADSSILASYSGDADLFFAEYAKDPSSDIDKYYSNQIASYLNKKIVHHKFDDSGSDVDKLIEQVRFVAANTEELVSDYTFWSTYQLSQAANKSGYKVMLSGMGGDEAFAGYPRYHVLKNHRFLQLIYPFLKLMLISRIYPRKLDKKFSRLISYIKENKWGVAYSRLLGYFSREELLSLFGNAESDFYLSYTAKLDRILENYNGDVNDKVKMGQYLDLYGFLPHNLMVSDKASMLASIELRVPLLDESVVANGIFESSSKLIDFNNTKKPLKYLLRSLLPKRFVKRPKTGFNPPLDTLINNIGKERLLFELGMFRNFISSDFAIKLINNHFDGIDNNSYKLWQLLYFKCWLDNNSNFDRQS